MKAQLSFQIILIFPESISCFCKYFPDVYLISKFDITANHLIITPENNIASGNCCLPFLKMELSKTEG